MSIRPRLGVKVPELTARVARGSNRPGRRRCGCGTGSTACGRTRTSPGGIPGTGGRESRLPRWPRWACCSGHRTAAEVALGHGEQVSSASAPWASDQPAV